MRWKKYKKGDAFSYAPGAFPTWELIQTRPDLVEEVLLSSSYRAAEPLVRALEERSLPYRVADRELARIYPKENIYVAGVFRCALPPVEDACHVLLDRVSDMGNAGTIMRTMLARGEHHLVTIGSTCDLLHPKVVRASMGALFHLHHSHFDTLEAYLAQFPLGTAPSARKAFFFWLQPTAVALPEVSVPTKWTIGFGNEGSGLSSAYEGQGTAVKIPQSSAVDSLNLPTAVAMGLYEFTKEKRWNP